MWRAIYPHIYSKKKTSWWLNQPIWKILVRQIGSISPNKGKHKKCLKPPPRRSLMGDSVLYIPYLHFLDIRNVRSARSGKTCVYLKPSSRNPRNLIVYLALALFDPEGSLYYQPKQCTIKGNSLQTGIFHNAWQTSSITKLFSLKGVFQEVDIKTPKQQCKTITYSLWCMQYAWYLFLI